MTHKLNADRTAAVSIDAFWLPIDKDTPRGVKMLLISEQYRVAQISVYQPSTKFFTHWHPLPKFKKDSK